MSQLSRIGPFAIEEHLGSDPQSSAYRAVHIEQRRTVALKVFPAPLISTDAQAKVALRREIETLKKVMHPNIARCYGGILENSHGCLASELVAGESLSELLGRRERLAWDTVAEYALQISQALEHAHEAGLVHEDLTPDKVMIDESQGIKVIDFRVDRSRNSTCVSSHKRTPERARYLSPEQLSDSTAASTKSDLYSLGCIIFHMLVGEPPFDGDSVEEIKRQHFEDTPPRVGAAVLDCPVWLESLVGELLEKEPAQRPHGAAAVRMALEETQRQVAAGTGVVEHAAGGFSPLSRQVDKDLARDLLRKARREQLKKPEKPAIHEQPWFLAICLALLVGAVATWALWPVSAADLLSDAKTIMAEREGVRRESARPILERLLRKFPEDEHADEARVLIDELDMASTERRFRIRSRLGKEPSSEAERLFAEAYRYEQFGDRLTAVSKYQSMVDLLADNEDRAFVNLARRQIAAIEGQNTEASEDRVAFVEQRLEDAARLADDGRLVDARKIWNGIVTLYGGNREFAVQVRQAQDRLEGEGATR